MLLLFKGIYQGMGNFAKIISGIINYILLLIVFILGIGTVSIGAKLFKKKKFLDKELNNKKSYWENTDISKRKREDYEKPF